MNLLCQSILFDIRALAAVAVQSLMGWTRAVSAAMVLPVVVGIYHTLHSPLHTEYDHNIHPSLDLKPHAYIAVR